MANGRLKSVDVNEPKYPILEAAPKLKRAPKTLRNWVANGKLPYLNIHGRIFITESTIQQILDESFVPAKDAA